MSESADPTGISSASTFAKRKKEIHLKPAPLWKYARAYIRVPASVVLPAEKGRPDRRGPGGQFRLGDADQDGTTYHVWSRRSFAFSLPLLALYSLCARVFLFLSSFLPSFLPFFSFSRIPGPLVIDELLLDTSTRLASTPPLLDRYRK